MRKITLFITITTMFCVSKSFGQDFLDKYDYQFAEKILRDSVYIKEMLWQSYGVEKTTKVEFIVIPVVDLNQNASVYDKNSRLMDFITLKHNCYYSLVLKDKKLLGFLGATCNVTNKVIIDTNKISEIINNFELVEKYKSKTCKWSHSYVTNFPGQSKINSYYDSCMYNTITKYKPKYFFMFPNAWELWFIDDNKLKAYSIHKKKVVTEKELISGIEKVISKKDSLYILKYAK